MGDHMILNTSIRFPNLGIDLNNVGKGIEVFGIDIAYYGMIIALGMICGWLIADWMAKKTGQDREIYLDFGLYAIIISVICARLYYVVFAWDEFADNPLQVFNIRTGGLAIYGGVLGAILTAVVYTKIKKVKFRLLADTGVIGLLLGQVIGRWGNFFNREAFGKFTNNLFAMQLNIKDVSSDYTTSLEVLAERYAGRPDAYERILEIRNNTIFLNGNTYIQVHPTFLYESLWNLVLMVLLIFYTKHKKFDGEIFLLYIIGYGLGRFWIEGLRTDQLFLWGSPIAVSQALAGAMVVIGTLIWGIMRIRCKKNANNIG